MDGILEKVHEAGLTLKAGCGIGYEFSTLRPKGAYVSGAGAYTSGPLSFMDIYDKMCFTVSSAGGRRGAQMATFEVGHPDAMDFIRAKREDGRLRQFNCSLLVTDEFMQAVEKNDKWSLAFPINEHESDGIELDNPEQVIWREWPDTHGYICREDGLVACRIYKTVPARRMWDMIMSSTYDFAEPGFIMIDRINEMNNNWFCENIRATNPCGEQPLPPYGACLLGSVNLTRFVDKPFTDEAEFNWEEYREVVRIFTRMLDNVVEINGLPLAKQRDEIARKRRHGMGFLGADDRHWHDRRLGAQGEFDAIEPIPMQLTDEEKTANSNAWRTYRERNASLLKHRGQAYSLILGQCTQLLQDKLKQEATWDVVSVSYDPFTMYRLIEKTILAQTEDQYPFATVYDQEQGFYTFRQDKLSSAQWYERFNTKIDVGESIGVTRQHKVLLEYCANEHTANTAFADLAAADQVIVRTDAEERYISYVFLRQSGTQHANLKAV